MCHILFNSCLVDVAFFQRSLLRQHSIRKRYDIEVNTRKKQKNTRKNAKFISETCKYSWSRRKWNNNKKSQSNTLHSSHLAKAFLRKHTFFLSPDIIFTASKCFPEFLLVQLFWCLVFICVSAKRVLHTFLARESRVHRHAITNNVR